MAYVHIGDGCGVVVQGSGVGVEGFGRIDSGAYTPKSNTRNRIPGTNCAEIAVSCIGFRGIRGYSAVQK
eukprot:3197976-Rhodomonas_salina.2